jgi:hypothetical protein
MCLRAALYLWHSNTVLGSILISCGIRKFTHQMIKIKVKFPVSNYLSTMPWRRMGNGGIAPSSLTSAPDGGNWTSSFPACLSSWRIFPDTHSIGGWEGHRVDLDDVERDSVAWNRSRAFQLVSRRYTDWVISIPPLNRSVRLKEMW